MDVEIPKEESLSIEWLTIDYNQAEKKLFMHLKVLPENEKIDSVNVEISSENYDSSFILYDDGNSGDLITQNNRFF